MGKASQRVQAERRMAEMPERIRELAEIDFPTNTNTMNTTDTMIEKAPLILAGKGYELLIAPDAAVRKQELIEAASLVTAVADNDESASAQFVSRKLAAMRIETEKCRKAVKEPVNRIGKLIDKTAADFIAEIEAEEKRINRLVGDHAVEVARIKREKEEAERRAFEEARAAREAAEAAAAAAESSGRISDIIAAKHAMHERTEALAARMEASADVAGTKIADGVRFAWDFEVEDIRRLAEALPEMVKIEPRRAEILAWLKQCEEQEIPIERDAQNVGIRAFKKPVVSSR
jgi:hypothetical protein